MDAEFRGYHDRTAPLTWGQRTIWRSVVEFAPDLSKSEKISTGRSLLDVLATRA